MLCITGLYAATYQLNREGRGCLTPSPSATRPIARCENGLPLPLACAIVPNLKLREVQYEAHVGMPLPGRPQWFLVRTSGGAALGEPLDQGSPPTSGTQLPRLPDDQNGNSLTFGVPDVNHRGKSSAVPGLVQEHPKNTEEATVVTPRIS
jgi:hypothetical protein